MITKSSSNKARQKRHLRVRNKISGTAERPRLSVYRSLKNMYIQLIDDTKGVTLVAASTQELEGSNGGNKGAAFEVGKLIGSKAIEKGIKTVVFDRSGYIYHGRVKEVADGAREAGLEF
ncbi:MAG: 50S ribosomal protein L18 [Clostridia bacterium]|nr:50S ribosomal protein L18 [Clostridia bacterium]MDO5479312.1 50S ribosomal protein L18 [Clostridia bacterium]